MTPLAFFSSGTRIICLLALLSVSDVVMAAEVEPCRACQQHRRAGWPQDVAFFAIPSNTKHYGWYHVGGGSLFRDEPRYVDEGTFGWDYSGILFPKGVALGWTHGRRYQSGSGAYRTVGPAPLRTQ